MFRIAVAAFALLASPVVALPTCGEPQEIKEGDVTVFEAGDNWQEQTIVNGGDTEVWYKLTVKNACEVSIFMNTCNVNSPSIAVEIYEAPVDCDSLGSAVEVPSVSAACQQPPTLPGAPSPPADLGSVAAFYHPKQEETTYLIRIKSVDLDGFDEDTETLKIAVQGSLVGTCGGDPHFRRWGQHVRDSFHGECDLVLFHNEVEGKPIDVHVRTTMEDSYSYVSGVAMKYGDDSIEFEHDSVYINGAKAEDEKSLSFGDFKIAMTDSKKRLFNVYVKDEVTVEVYSTKKFMSVSIKGNHEGMAGSTGILGDFETGDMIARDGSKMEDFQDFGFEWQVAPSDPQIFHFAREPQLPYERCHMPSVSAEARRRKLRGQDRKLYEQAVAACTKNHIPENFQSCVDDVMFTGEIELAEAL